MENRINTRMAQKHDIEANWNKASNFIPKAGEIVVYDVDENYNSPRMKIGDGVTTVENLPFLNSAASAAITTEQIDAICGATIETASMSEVTF